MSNMDKVKEILIRDFKLISPMAQKELEFNAQQVAYQMDDLYAEKIAEAKKEEREKVLAKIEDYLSPMLNPKGTPGYYMISKDDWQALKGGE